MHRRSHAYTTCSTLSLGIGLQKLPNCTSGTGGQGTQSHSSVVPWTAAAELLLQHLLRRWRTTTDQLPSQNHASLHPALPLLCHPKQTLTVEAPMLPPTYN
jgi:hypothetical protein